MTGVDPREEVRKKLGLDQRSPEQFRRYVVDLSRGDLGKLLPTGQPVLADLKARLPASAGVSMHVFFSGLLLVYVFCFLLQITPAPLGRLDVFASAHGVSSVLWTAWAALGRRAQTCPPRPQVANEAGGAPKADI
jgi:ABC-type dipeptide/oligopeptide/nickel transport system permease component